MNTDIFGISRDVKATGELASSEFAAIRIGNKDSTPRLIQALNWRYNREMQTVFEVGSSSVYFQSGRASGNVDISRLVGKSGFGELIADAKDNCGVIGLISVSLGKGDKCSVQAVSGSSKLSFDAAMLTSIGGGLANTQGTTITEDISMAVAGLKIG